MQKQIVVCHPPCNLGAHNLQRAPQRWRAWEVIWKGKRETTGSGVSITDIMIKKRMQVYEQRENTRYRKKYRF